MSIKALSGVYKGFAKKYCFLLQRSVLLTELCRDFSDVFRNCSRFEYEGYTLLYMKVKLKCAENSLKLVACGL